MTRRKRPPPQRKLQQITDSSGWTHVIKGPPGTVNAGTTGIRLEDGKSTGTKYTLEPYLDRFREHYAPIWQGSDCFKSLSRMFEQDILPAENILITQCVCLGLGSMTAGSESSSYELAALISILEMLGPGAPNMERSIPHRAQLIQIYRQETPHPGHRLSRPRLQRARPHHSGKSWLHRRPKP